MKSLVSPRVFGSQLDDAVEPAFDPSRWVPEEAHGPGALGDDPLAQVAGQHLVGDDLEVGAVEVVQHARAR